MRRIVFIMLMLFGMSTLAQSDHNRVVRVVTIENVVFTFFEDNKVSISTTNSDCVEVEITNKKDKSEYTKFKVSNEFSTTFRLSEKNDKYTLLVRNKNKSTCIKL